MNLLMFMQVDFVKNKIFLEPNWFYQGVVVMLGVDA